MDVYDLYINMTLSPNKPVMAILADHLLVPSSTDCLTEVE